MMKKTMIIATVLSLLLTGSLAFGNPAMLPKHPGYPMGEFKDPVLGVPTSYDAGQEVPSPEEAIQQAAAFHDAHAVNPMEEKRPNIVYDFKTSNESASRDGKAS